MKYYLQQLLIIIFIAVAGGFIGLFIWQNHLQQKTTPSSQVSITPLQTKIQFDSQTASLNGKIIKIERDILSVQDVKNNVDTFTVDAGIQIGQIGKIQLDTTKNELPHSDVKEIILNKDATITFIIKNNTYFITGVFYQK